MGTGNYAGFADTVADKFVREICPDEMDNLQIVLDDADYDWERLSYASNWDMEGGLRTDMDKESASLITQAYNKLCIAFLKKTGLNLHIGFHDADDRGDEINGVFWAVEGVYILSPAGEKYKDQIERKFFTTFG